VARRIMSFPLFAVRRLLTAAVLAVVVAALTFLWLHGMYPEAFGDTRPLPVELWDFLVRTFVHLDLGDSVSRPLGPVKTLVGRGLMADLSLLVGAMVCGVAAGAYTPLMIGNIVRLEKVFDVPGVYKLIPHALDVAGRDRPARADGLAVGPGHVVRAVDCGPVNVNSMLGRGAGTRAWVSSHTRPAPASARQTHSSPTGQARRSGRRAIRSSPPRRSRRPAPRRRGPGPPRTCVGTAAA
jgi:hypothetical protein